MAIKLRKMRVMTMHMMQRKNVVKVGSMFRSNRLDWPRTLFCKLRLYKIEPSLNTVVLFRRDFQ